MWRHVETYLDESGDLGFSEGGSEHFLVVALTVTGHENLARVTGKCLRRYGHLLKGNPEVKFNSSPRAVRRFVLESISSTDATIHWTAVRKSDIPVQRRSDKHAIWRETACRTVAQVSASTRARSMQVVIDRRSMKKDDLNVADLSLHTAAVLHPRGYFPPSVSVTHLDSSSSPGLRVVDHVAGAVFQNIERGDAEYTDIIERNIEGGLVMVPCEAAPGWSVLATTIR